MTPEHLVTALAAIAKGVGVRWLSLNTSREAFDLLASLPDSERVVRVYRRDGLAPFVIECVEVTRDGVRIDAQWDRPAEPAEVAQLEHAARLHRNEFHCASLTEAPDGAAAV